MKSILLTSNVLEGFKDICAVILQYKIEIQFFSFCIQTKNEMSPTRLIHKRAFQRKLVRKASFVYNLSFYKNDFHLLQHKFCIIQALLFIIMNGYTSK